MSDIQTQALVDIRNIEVNYGNIKALKGISLQVPSGDICCLIGANGAGKSTLLKAMVGLEPLAGGEIRFDGQTIASAERGSKSLPTNLVVADMWGLSDYGRAKPQLHAANLTRVTPLGGSAPGGYYAGNRG